jgi:HD-like signal output (HDOD) protein
MFVTTMLHDLGKLIVAIHAPDDWRAISERAEKEHLSISRAEDDYWGIDHGVIGALVLKSWNLPLQLTEPVNWHHYPGLAGEHIRLTSILSLADALYYEFDADAPPHTCNYHELLSALNMQEDLAVEAAREAVSDERVDQLVQTLLG